MLDSAAGAASPGWLGVAACLGGFAWGLGRAILGPLEPFGNGSAGESSRPLIEALADRVVTGLRLGAAEFGEGVGVIDAEVDPAVGVPDSSLIPWPDADGLRRLAERRALRRDKQA